MALLRRRYGGPGPALPAGPNTVVALIAWILEDRDRTVRCAILLSCVLFAVVAGVTAGISFVVMAEEGVHGVRLRYLLPSGILTGGSVLTWTYIWVRGAFRKRKQRQASATTPPAKR